MVKTGEKIETGGQGRELSVDAEARGWVWEPGMGAEAGEMYRLGDRGQHGGRGWEKVEVGGWDEVKGPKIAEAGKGIIRTRRKGQRGAQQVISRLYLCFSQYFHFTFTSFPT